MRKLGAEPYRHGERRNARKLMVPIALTIAISATAITVATTAITVATNAGCGGDDGPTVDAGPPDTPIV
ncbi:MAG TPA: hypothetical protein VIV40_37480 [Kofleriaceae bacterium]